VVDRAIRIAVIGGGIGGTVTALSLLRGGCDVLVCEQSSALRQIGASIQISPNVCAFGEG
jgi:salicylate hydroxylase